MYTYTSRKIDFFFFLALHISTLTEMLLLIHDTRVEYVGMTRDLSRWHYDNPPQTAAIMMVISDSVEIISSLLVALLQQNNYNFFLAYFIRPYKMSFLLTSAEWL